jgi:hypothetical protein
VSENLELVRSISAMWEQGDFGSAAWAHPDIELVAVDGPEPGTWTGLTGMASGWRSWLHAFSDFRIEVDEDRELDDQRVLVLLRRVGRGKASGFKLERLGSEGACVFTVSEGQVRRFVTYWDRERGLADLGLEK